MALDISGNWEVGDDLSVIEALKLPFGSYTLDCIQDCMNQLEVISGDAVLKVKALLVDYGVARGAQEAANLADTEGKTLVKADVLEWERNGGNGMDGLQAEILQIQRDLAHWFAFCECINLDAMYGGLHTSLVRS
jgi:hypothetical protein